MPFFRRLFHEYYLRKALCGNRFFCRIVDHLAEYLHFLNEVIISTDLQVYHECFSSDLTAGKIAANGSVLTGEAEIAVNLARRKASLNDPDFGLLTFEQSLSQNAPVIPAFKAAISGSDIDAEKMDIEATDTDPTCE